MLSSDLAEHVLAFAMQQADDAHAHQRFDQRTISCAWFPHGEAVAVASMMNYLYVVRAKDARVMRTIEIGPPDSMIDCVACSSLGVLAVAEHCGRITLWEEGREERVNEMVGAPSGFQSMCFDAAGSMLITGSNSFGENVVTIWGVPSCRELARWDMGHPLLSLDWSPDSLTIATCSKDESVMLWRLDGNMRARPHAELACHAWVDIVRFVPVDSSKLIAALAASGRMMLWVNVDGAKGEARVARVFESSPIDFEISRSAECLAFSVDGGRFAAAWARNTSVKLWEDIESGPRVRPLWGTSIGEIFACAFSPKDPDVLCVVSYEGAVQFWHVGPWGRRKHRRFSPKERKRVRVAFATMTRNSEKKGRRRSDHRTGYGVGGLTPGSELYR